MHVCMYACMHACIHLYMMRPVCSTLNLKSILESPRQGKTHRGFLSKTNAELTVHCAGAIAGFVIDVVKDITVDVYTRTHKTEIRRRGTKPLSLGFFPNPQVHRVPDGRCIAKFEGAARPRAARPRAAVHRSAVQSRPRRYRPKELCCIVHGFVLPLRAPFVGLTRILQGAVAPKSDKRRDSVRRVRCQDHAGGVG